MAVSMRSSMRRSEHVPVHGHTRLVTELRGLLDRAGDRSRVQLVAEFVARHHLTHRDVDSLLVALAQPMPRPAASVEDAAAGVILLSADRPVVLAGASAPGPGDMAATGDEPSTMPDDASVDAGADDLAWMFGQEPVAPMPRARDDVVGQAFDDLSGDWTRSGGRLGRADVALLAARRQLSADQRVELSMLLDQAGIELVDQIAARPPAGPDGDGRAGDDIGRYLREIGRYPLIGAQREVALWSLISDGQLAQRELQGVGDALPPAARHRLEVRVRDGRRAHAELVCANLRLVVSIARARHYDSSGVEFADRIQDGNLGLMHAAYKFDGSKGFKFSTYATWWIKQAIDRGIGDRGRTIRIPIHMHEKVRKVRRAVGRLTSLLDREPTLAEICERTGLEGGSVQAVLELMRPVRSLDALLGEEGDLHLSDVLVAEDERDGRADPAEVVVHAMLHHDLTKTMDALLPARSVAVLERRFGLHTGEEETLDGIAIEYGITRERVRQIQAKALRTMAESAEAVRLRAYLVDGSEPTGPYVRVVERKTS